MFASRGRGGPSRPTPANVQCQKCLKRDKCAASHRLEAEADMSSRHYSYECTASAQERPYVSRPSRSQQLRNPKLVPKLTADALEPPEKKKGVADEEIAKREGERARKRERELREHDSLRSLPKRRRSASSDSVSTISTDASRGSRPPRGRTGSPTPPKRRHIPEPASGRRQPRGRSPSRSPNRIPNRIPSLSPGRSPSRSPSPPPRRLRSWSRHSRSPAPERPGRSYRAREDRFYRDHEAGGYGKRPRPDSFGSRDVRRSPSGRRHHSSSPDADARRRRDYEHPAPPRRDREDGGRAERSDRGPGNLGANDPPRERSLGPFSKRLAMTREMQGGSK